MPRPMSPARRQALDAGFRFYIGPPCRLGHGMAGALNGQPGAWRYTSTNACRECVKQQARPDRVKRCDPLAELLG